MSRLQVPITWVPVFEEFPDAELTVIASISGGDEPTWPAFTNGKDWFDACTGEELSGRVTHWAEMPMGVER